jgi:hypothetical protein
MKKVHELLAIWQVGKNELPTREIIIRIIHIKTKKSETVLQLF